MKWLALSPWHSLCAFLLESSTSSITTIKTKTNRGAGMETVSAVFNSFEAARRAAGDLRNNGMPERNINFLAPAASEEEIRRIPTEDAEQPGMGKAVGGVMGAAVGSSFRTGRPGSKCFGAPDQNGD
jgi:hypothetical protein